MKYIAIFLFIGTLAFTSCKSAIKSDPSQAQQFFGEKITMDDAISYDALLGKLEGTEEVETKVRGTVESVCKVKGCWVNIVSKDDPAAEGMFVKFKDYGFFLPKDIEGKEVVMTGEAYREITSVDELKHYAEDEGLSKEEIANITEPKEELKFMADGVILIN